MRQPATDGPTLPMSPEDRVLWAMWNGKLQAEGLGMRVGSMGGKDGANVPFDDGVHAPVACVHGVAPLACGVCTGTDNYRNIRALIAAMRERRTLDNARIDEEAN